jgi:tetratricopeptide (TPR) repeat protein
MLPNARPLAAASLLLAMAACGPKPLPPAPAPAAAAPLDSAALDRMSETTARQIFDEGTALARQGRWREAEARYRQAIATRPSEPTYPFALAAALLSQQRVADAAVAFKAGIDAEEAAPLPNHRLLAEDYERYIQILTRAGRAEDIPAARDRQRYHREIRDAQLP